MTDLNELLGRVEAATGPDRKLDADISIALGLWAPPKGFVRSKDNVWRWERDGINAYHPATWRDISASLVAALELVERERPGGLGWWVEMETAGMSAILHGPDGETFKGGGVGKDLPTALLAALLKSLLADQTPEPSPDLSKGES